MIRGELVLGAVLKVVVPAEFVEGWFTCFDMGLGLGLFHDRGLYLEGVPQDGFINRIADDLFVCCRVEILTQVSALPNQFSSKVEK